MIQEVKLKQDNKKAENSKSSYLYGLSDFFTGLVIATEFQLKKEAILLIDKDENFDAVLAQIATSDNFSIKQKIELIYIFYNKTKNFDTLLAAQKEKMHKITLQTLGAAKKCFQDEIGEVVYLKAREILASPIPNSYFGFSEKVSFFGYSIPLDALGTHNSLNHSIVVFLDNVFKWSDNKDSQTTLLSRVFG